MQQIEIHFKGQIFLKWQQWFDDLTISQSNQGFMVLSGIVTDQAALYGVISHLRDLGLELISVSSMEVGQEVNQK
jgi:type II secretory ATPase GspE/PulE/Tfp pilus assembly ATPase PilB-like protein